MKSKPASQQSPFVGTWHIYEMDMWDEDYFNMETQAYIEIQQDYEASSNLDSLLVVLMER